MLPTASEVRAFLADVSTGKRDRVIEQVLKRPEFTDYLAYARWSNVTGNQVLPVCRNSFPF